MRVASQRLIAAPDHGEQVLENIESCLQSLTNETAERLVLKRHFLAIQSDYRYYFGDNSLFNSNDRRIYDYLGFDDELNDFVFQRKAGKKYNLSDFMEIRSYPFFNYLTKLSASDTLQEHLDAMLQVVDPVTRYPYDLGKEDGRVCH